MERQVRCEQAGRQILIRPMMEEDLDDVSRMEEETFSMPWSKDDFRHMIESKDALYVTALVDGSVAGCCGVINGGGDGDICNVVVNPTYRRQGLARMMLSALMEWGGDIGISAYTLEVRAGNQPAISLYESLGFVNEGVRPRFYEKPVEDAVIMWKRTAVNG